MSSQENTTPDAGNAKINEYVNRILAGESFESITQGLSPAFINAIKEKLPSTENSKEVRLPTPETNNDSDKLISNFKEQPDAEYLRELLEHLVPSKYHSFIAHPEILQEMWTHRYLTDSNLEEVERQKRETALGLAQELQNFVQKNISKTQEQEKIQDLKNEIAGKEKELKTKQENIASIDLPDQILHRFENKEKGFEAVFWNNDKSQDAFAIKDKTFVVADGAGSYEKSGIVSSLLSEKLANIASTASSFEEFQNIFSKEKITSILEEIKSDESYQNFSTERRFKNKEEGLTTFAVTKESTDGNFIEYASVGDSPIFVVDTDENGIITNFQLVNDTFNETKIDHNNFSNPEVNQYLNNPETELIGIRKDGRVSVSSLERMKLGKIAKKEGRTILVASDSLIKMMLNSPHALRELAQSKPSEIVKEGFNQKAKNEAQEYPELWNKNGGLDFDFFFKNGDILETLNKWKANNYNFTDDLTLIKISAEK